MLAEVPLSNGEFSFPAYEGSYLVGLWLPPGSDYDFPDEKLFHVEIDANGDAVLKDENNTVITQAVFEISSISSSLSGKFKDSQGTLTGLSGEVYAMRTNGSGWRSTEFTNGTYSMSLPEGNWLVDYFITQDDGNNSYPSYPAQPFRVTVNKDTTYHFDLSDVEVISASISGTVRDETGTAPRIPWFMSGLFVKKITNFQNSGMKCRRTKMETLAYLFSRAVVMKWEFFFLKICERRATWMLLYSSFV